MKSVDQPVHNWALLVQPARSRREGERRHPGYAVSRSGMLGRASLARSQRDEILQPARVRGTPIRNARPEVGIGGSIRRQKLYLP